MTPNAFHWTGWAGWADWTPMAESTLRFDRRGKHRLNSLRISWGMEGDSIEIATLRVNQIRVSRFPFIRFGSNRREFPPVRAMARDSQNNGNSLISIGYPENGAFGTFYAM